MKKIKGSTIGLITSVSVFLISYDITHAKKIGEVINDVTTILSTQVSKLIFAIALLFFFWGVVQYTINPTEEAKDRGRMYMTWGLIALTVMFSVYALIKIISNTFDLGADNTQLPIPSLPQVQ